MIRLLTVRTSLAFTCLLGIAAPVFSSPALAAEYNPPLPVSTTDFTAPASRVTVKCHLVRIRDSYTIGYVVGHGATKKEAMKDADRNVPRGHYKRHCNTVGGRGSGGSFSHDPELPR
ncbi:hypothetical protein CCYS_04450 [Corynebacterium cystitidis DSM 20524]|uniref:Secreted protein n=1 Tax=Corynebacterium cystitidis DSM 20524 TaxID=1121357 RepID=A0A1H9WDI4_9CORY|nr:hypothetical protein CCYS_04450 [Corynebacterium cystitidis DSM 20524]SES31841.1 hypothetical protein SAMN05661109_02677 [Corynebacterium cystitidis DSM 20524]SNV82979.1 Uncharacterised protein [Corynebacterium cystitidis]